MRRALSLSIFAGLALCATGATLAQSRTVSTANMPKPGVSYIAGPSTPVRKETVSTGTLPQPARLYAGGQGGTGASSRQDGYDSGNYPPDNGSYNNGGYYGGGYGGGYGNGYGYGYGRDDGYGYGRGVRDHDHDHGQPGNGGRDRDHDRRPPGNSTTVAQSPGSAHTGATGPAMNLAPDRNGPRGPRDSGNNRGENGWNDGFGSRTPTQPRSGVTNRVTQPGIGTPVRGGNGWNGR